MELAPQQTLLPVVADHSSHSLGQALTDGRGQAVDVVSPLRVLLRVVFYGRGEGLEADHAARRSPGRGRVHDDGLRDHQRLIWLLLVRLVVLRVL